MGKSLKRPALFLSISSTVLAVVMSLPARAASVDAPTAAFWTYISNRSNDIVPVNKNPILSYWENLSKSNSEYLSSLDQSVKTIEEQRTRSIDPTDLKALTASADQTAKLAQEVVRNMKLHIELRAGLPTSDRIQREAPFLNEVMTKALWLRAYSNEEQKLLAAAVKDASLGEKIRQVEAHRLASYSAFQAYQSATNRSGLSRAQDALDTVRSADFVYRSQSHSDAEQRDHVFELYGQLLDETTLVGYGASTFGLTIPERLSIYLYSGGLYMLVNGGLWNGGDDEARNRDFVTYLNLALRKLPDLKAVVYRKAHVGADQLALQTIGASVVFKGFTSTSVDNGYKSTANVTYIIQSLHGHRIQSFSYHTVENEVLFASGSQFTVTDRHEFPDGRTEISLSEK